MISRQPASRWALWAFAVVLLLKAAVPLLATASAHLQGKALLEVCTVYGVATVALDGQESAPHPKHAQPHGGDHCTLSGLAALAAPLAPEAAQPMSARVGPPAFSRPCAPAPDACATWMARLKHGPPACA